MKPNPFDDQVYFDSCAYDGGDESEQKASLEARVLYKTHRGKILIPHSVESEIQNPITPEWIKEVANASIRTVKIPLTKEEVKTVKEIQDIIVGNGSIEKQEADCIHIFEAQKYGHYFVTSDRGIYKHSEKIREKYGLYIVKPSEFLELVKHYANKT